MTDIAIVRDKDTCLVCGGPIYEGRMQLADPETEGKAWKWARGFECLCGRWVRDRRGNRLFVERLEDRAHNDHLRQIAELMRDAASPQEAGERINRALAEDEA